MEIFITKGIGEGRTNIAAFDKALMEANIADYNLIYLSSIIPPSSVVKIEKPEVGEEEYGKRLYIVRAVAEQSVTGKEAWAGIGWTQGKDGKGLLAEHHAEDRETVVRLIKSSLEDMKEMRDHEYGDICYEVAGIRCNDKPVCSVVAAVFQSEKW